MQVGGRLRLLPAGGSVVVRVLSGLTGLSMLGALMSPAAHGQCIAWTPPANLSQDSGHYAVDGNLSVDAAGKVHLVYQSFLDSDGAAFYVTNQDGNWSSPQLLGSFGGKGSAPKIVITPDHQVHAFYGRGSLYWRSKPVSGGSWTGAVRVDAELASGSFIQAITVDSSGGIYLLFGHLFDDTAPVRNGIYGKYKPLGGAWGPLEVVYGNSSDGNWPRGEDIAARGDTLWVSIGVDGDAYFKKKPSTGVWPTGKGTRLVTDAGGMRFAFSPVSGEIGAFYGQSLSCTDPCEDDPWYEVFVKYSYDDGATWSAPYDISDLTDDIDRTPSAVYDSNGDLHVVWEGFCCDHKLRMRYRGRINGVWDPVITRVANHPGGHIPNSIQSFGTDLFLTFSDSDTGIGLYDVVFTSSIASQPQIGLSSTSFSRTTLVGSAVSDDTLMVGNACAGELNYTLSDDAIWLDISPTSGSAIAESDPITISYPTAASMKAGTYNAAITVSGNASNSPRTVAVELKVQSVKPDFDGDGDVDQADFGHLQKCMSGFGVPQLDPTCANALLNVDDNFVDAQDLGIFLGCFSGSDVHADTACAALYP